MTGNSITSATAIFSQVRKQLRPLTAHPAPDAVKVQQDKRRRILASVARSPTLETLTGRHLRMRDQILTSVGRSPALEAFAGQNQEMRDQILMATGRSPALAKLTGENREWRDKVLQMVDASSILDSWSAQRHDRYRELLAAAGNSAALGQAFKKWTSVLPPGVADQMAAFQARLLADIASAAPAELVDEEKGEAWFGAESWSRLYFEMVTILRCAELMMAGMFAAKEGLGAPIPPAVLYLLYMFIAAGELAAHLAKDALPDSEA